jgi:4-carboxymuconolactone decarboxylase
MRYLLTLVLTVAALTSPFDSRTLAQGTGNARFPELRPEQYSPAQKAFVAELTKPPRNGNVSTGPFRVYLRSPEFGRHALGMSDYLRWGTSLDPRLIEFTILISARHWSSSYIWRAHYPAAVKNGLDPKIPAAMAAGRRPEGMKPDETAIYDLLTEMYRDKRVSDAAFNAAVTKYGEKGVTDIVGLASYYGITAMALIASNAPTLPGEEPKLQTMAQVFPR